MGKNNKKAMFTKFVGFRCSPKVQLFLDAMAAQAELSRSSFLNYLVMEEAERRGIKINPVEVQNEKES